MLAKILSFLKLRVSVEDRPGKMKAHGPARTNSYNPATTEQVKLEKPGIAGITALDSSGAAGLESEGRRGGGRSEDLAF